MISMDKNKAAVDLFNKLAENYEQKFMNVDLYINSLDFFCSSLKMENPKVLDMACGPGNVASYLLAKSSDLEILGIDLAPNMIALAKKNNPNADFQLLDGRKMSAITKRFDGIMCAFLLPYLSKEEAIKLIDDIYLKLNPGGLCYISTMEDDYANSALKKGSTGDEIFMHYHEEGYLVDTLLKNKMEILKVERKVYKGQDGTKIKDLIIIAAK